MNRRLRLISFGVTLIAICAIAQAQTNTFPASGNVGIGTTAPAYKLDLVGAGASQRIVNNANGGYGVSLFLAGNTGGSTIYGTQIYMLDYPTNAGTDLGYGLHFRVGSASNGINFGRTPNTAGTDTQGDTVWMTINNAGNVGIGTTNPQAKLELNGNLRFTADGSVQTTAWTGVLCGGDYAESVDVTGGKAAYSPGDVMVVDSGLPGNFLKSNEPYSTLVAGIYSTKPGVVGKRSTGPDTSKSEVPMAMVGVVPTKVSAENGPVKPGDLLVTSSTPGYAMKGTDRERIAGAVLGKALGSVSNGTGVIEVLVTLQ